MAKTKEKQKAQTPAETPVEYASAMDKLRDEMAKEKGRYVEVVGEFLTDYLLKHPEAEAAILTKGKTIKGSLDAMRAEASKHQDGNVGILDDATAFGVVIKYFGIKGETGAATSSVSTLRVDPPSPKGEGKKDPDPLDLDALLGAL